MLIFFPCPPKAPIEIEIWTTEIAKGFRFKGAYFHYSARLSPGIIIK